MKLEEAFAWVLHSNEHTSTELKKSVKYNLSRKNRWNQNAYHFLSQVLVLLDIDDAYRYVKQAFKYFKKNPALDTFTLQNVGYIGVNFLNCCYHQKAPREYSEFAIDFLKKDLPADPSVGIEKVIVNYYQALIDENHSKRDVIVEVLKDSGYYSIIQDTMN